MALSISDVCRLTGETLRRECEVRGLDHNGQVRALRQRLADHIRGTQMDITAKTEVTQASDSNVFVINADITDPPGVPSASRGSGADAQIPVLVELLRPIPHLTSEEPEAIMCLFIKLDEVHGLGMVEDSVYH